MGSTPIIPIIGGTAADCVPPALPESLWVLVVEIPEMDPPSLEKVDVYHFPQLNG
ncbi:predicted protein [Uncinocarpus reesii 1704]|uniref:Uncharacterized protein n=1 Tax=Uncinocarpus reesii (strain UAMH 1704) TaxID=336963 RepID=C4JDS8_UNCRE|nr:uncharacterized protein UREG_00555 [Uncinocarpus reesii 1704]EEP75708.1 predicted protein [Uncinocarpus reesii 1704]